MFPARLKFYFMQSDETCVHIRNSPREHITRLSYTIDRNYLTEARMKVEGDGFLVTRTAC